MLKVWIDYSTITSDKLTGIGRYIVELSTELKKSLKLTLKVHVNFPDGKNTIK